MRVLRLLILAGNLVAPWGKAATYYVAPDGDDSQDGTLDAPFRTLTRGAMVAGPGDTVMVRDGTYGHENAVSGGDGADFAASPVVLVLSGTPAAWITFQAENKGAAVLDCEMICDSYFNLRNASYIVIQGFVITRGYKEGIHSNDAAHHITLRGNRFEYIANRVTSTRLGLDGMYTNPNCHDFVIDGNVFHDIGRTNAAQLDHGLYLRGTNFTVINNIFYNIQRGWPIQAAQGLTNVLIANNTFASLNEGALIGQIMLWNVQTTLAIQNNIFFQPRDYAIVRYSSSVTECFVDHNLLYGALGLILDSSGCIVGTNQIGPDPLFVNVSIFPYDFHVQPVAPGIDAGVNISGVATDFDGLARPQGLSTDLGAYEYGTMTVAPSSGSVTNGTQQTFTLTYPDTPGFAGAAFGWQQFLVAVASNGGGQPFCYVHYDRAGNALWMYSSDVGFFLGPVTPGTASNALTSSACSVNTASATVQNTAGNLVLAVPITLKAPMVGAQKLFERSLTVLNVDTSFVQTGTFTVN